MIREVSALLRGVRGLTFTISREEGSEDRLQVMLTSSLGEEPKGADEAIQQMRAVLAVPLVIRGTADELDAVLPDLIGRAAIAREAVAVQLDESVQAIEAAAREASEQAKQKNGAKAAARAAKTGPAPKAVQGGPSATPSVPSTGERRKPGPKPGWKAAKMAGALDGVSAANPAPAGEAVRKKPGPKPGWKAAKAAAAQSSGSATEPQSDADFPQSLLFGKEGSASPAPAAAGGPSDGLAAKEPTPIAPPEAGSDEAAPGASSTSIADDGDSGDAA